MHDDNLTSSAGDEDFERLGIRLSAVDLDAVWRAIINPPEPTAYLIQAFKGHREQDAATAFQL